MEEYKLFFALMQNQASWASALFMYVNVTGLSASGHFMDAESPPAGTLNNFFIFNLAKPEISEKYILFNKGIHENRVS